MALVQDLPGRTVPQVAHCRECVPASMALSRNVCFAKGPKLRKVTYFIRSIPVPYEAVLKNAKGTLARSWGANVAATRAQADRYK